MSTLKSLILHNVGAVRHPKLKLTQTRKCILHNLGTKRNVMRLVQSITFFPSFFLTFLGLNQEGLQTCLIFCFNKMSEVCKVNNWQLIQNDVTCIHCK